MENSCVFPYSFPFLVGIGLDHNLHIFCNNLHFKRLQTVRSVASSGKFYRLPPDKENTARLNMDFTIFFNVIVSDLSKRSLSFKTKT